MYKFKVIEKSGAYIEYFAEAPMDWSKFGHGDDYTVEQTDVTKEFKLAEVMKKRIAEYPTPEEFLNKFFDGGLEELREKRLLVKEKYPKPV